MMMMYELNMSFCLVPMHMTTYFMQFHTVLTSGVSVLSLAPAPPTVYVWQQHVCAAALRGCDGVWEGEGDRGGE